jgi:hypothetical protein
MRWTDGVRVLDVEIDTSLLHAAETGTESHPVFCPVGIWDCFLWSKAAGI